ncbi:MAG: FecR domain-containing protein [Proteobacteria bacterium]|nr:FecR domain-containing protein [Pseudomonadota bacterium]
MLKSILQKDGFTLPLSLLVCLCLSPGSTLGAEKSALPALHKQGKVFVLKGKDKEKKYIPLPKKGLLKNAHLRVGEEIEPQMLMKDPEKLSKNQLVLSYSEREMITLASGAKINRQLSKEKIPEYQVSGTAHLFILQKKKDPQPFKFSLNNIPFQTTNGHLFITDLQPGQLEFTLIDGTLQAEISGDVVDVKPNEKVKLISPEKGQSGKQGAHTIKLVALDRLVIKEKVVEIHHKTLLKNPVYKFSVVPGFEASGSYQSAGFARFSKEALQITRNKKVSQLSISPAVLFVGDEILTKDKQRAILSLKSKDKIRLYGNTKFKIEQFEIATKKEKKGTILMSFLGKIRAKISKRKKRGRIRFRTATAVIGIKGTDFEANASNAGSEIATVEGNVGVADADGNGEVEVKAGQLTTVAAGALPAAPTPIPPERLKALNESGLGINPEDIIPLEDVTFTLPQEGTSYSEGSLNFQLKPENASFEVLLDNAVNLQVLQGYELKSLAAGKHSLTIRGLGENPFSRTVSFSVDQKKGPQLATSSKLEEKILKIGEPLTLDWNMEIKSVKIVLPGQEVLAQMDEQNKKRSLFKTEALFKEFAKKTEGIVNLEVTDLKGNISKISGKIKLQAQAGKAPAILIGEGKLPDAINLISDVVISVDRKIKKWEVTLDQNPLVLPEQKDVKVTEGTEGPPNELLLSKGLFKSLNEGAHQLSVKGTDESNITGSATWKFVLDKTPPQVVLPLVLLNQGDDSGTAPGLKKLLFNKDESIQINFSEGVQNTKLIISGQTLNLSANKNLKSVTLASSAIQKLLSNKISSPYLIELEDMAGNPLKLVGNLELMKSSASKPAAMMKTAGSKSGSTKPREIALKENFQDSILNQTGKDSDQIMLVDRPPFQLNNIKPLDALEKGAKHKGFEFKTKEPSEFHKSLDDPFLNNF